MQKTLFIGADHRGFEKKQQLFDFLRDNTSLNLVDCGAAELDPEDDFNDPAIKVAKSVKSTENSFGLLLCGSSFGVCIQANRFKGIRAVNPLTPDTAQLSRQHNAANILCLSADQLSLENMKQILEVFLATEPSLNPKYLRRNHKLDEERTNG